jgi:hypothetical protein
LRTGGNETARVRAILDALELRGHWAWRANSGTQVIAASGQNRRRVIRGAPPGTPDILVVLPGGRLGGLEVKTDSGRQSASQRLWEAKAARHRVRYAVVRSAREAIATVEAWLCSIS